MNVRTEEIGRYRAVALAVSGGRDSMSMLHFFLRGDFTRFYVVHVNHGLRGAESDADEALVREYCASNGVMCKVYREDIRAYCRKYGFTLEQGARARRREIYFEQLRGTAERVVTAHHRDDQAESVLMHVLRGCGINGLCGMRADDGKLLRPFLDVTRAEIDAYAKENDVPWREDASNDDNAFARNFLRSEALPLLERVFPAARAALARLAAHAAQATDFIERECVRPQRCGNGVKAPIAAFSGERTLAVQNVLRCARALEGDIDLTRRHIEAVIALANKSDGARADLPRSVRVFRDGNELIFSVGPVRSDTPTARRLREGTFAWGTWEISIRMQEYRTENDPDARIAAVGALRAQQSADEKILLLDADKARDCVFRTRRNGDYFRKFGGGGKPLAEFLTDRKVPVALRDTLPVLAAGDNRIAAVIPYEISADFAVDGATRRVYVLRIQTKETETHYGNDTGSLV